MAARVAEADLKRALADSRKEVRAAAVDALFKLFVGQAIEIIASGPAPLAEDVISRLESLGKKSVPAFVKSLGVRSHSVGRRKSEEGGCKSWRMWYRSLLFVK